MIVCGDGAAMDEIYDGISEDDFLALMREFGLRAELVRNPDGPGTIRAPMGTIWFVVYFFRGTGETANTVASFVTFIDMRLPLPFHNRWNRVHLFPKAIAGDDGHAVLEMNVVLRGVTRAYVRRCLTVWNNAVGLFLEEAGRYLEHLPDVENGPGGR
jgi:hypothetical protein